MIKSILKKIIPPFLLDFYHLSWAFISAVFYGFPSKGMIVIGITGTNGKSTVVDLTHRILMEAEFRVASLSSIRFQINDNQQKNRLKMTMPGRFAVQRFIANAKEQDCKYVIVETTSEGIKQYRHKFIDYDIAAITNLRPEHIESHGSFENYKNAKGELFKALSGVRKKNIPKISIVNLDDQNADYFLSFKTDQKWGYSLKEKTAKIDKVIFSSNYQVFPDKTIFHIGQTKFEIKLLGEFNISNVLAAICIGLSQNIALQIIKRAIEKTDNIPGRMEQVVSSPFKVFVDYAHTPDALEAVYKTAKQGSNALICVLGSCGGGRDRWKRPEMGRIASNNCQKIILTNEDPYDENPESILDDIQKGIENKNTQRIIDRRQAINQALKIARPGDVVLVTGKGSEPWMCMPDGQKLAWDDREIVKEELNKLQI